MAARSPVRRQLRGFVIIWTAITFVIGAATFFAIYLTYGGTTTGTLSRNVALPSNNVTPNAAAGVPIVAQPSNTPTRAATTTPTAIVVAQAEETEAAPAIQAEPPTATPTLLPVDDKQFAVGIQVQHSPDLNPENQDMWMREVKEKLHMDWFKHQVRWEELEPEKGQYNWSSLDLVMPSAERFGLKVMLSIVTAPAWSREQGIDTSKHGPPANYQDYANFVVELMKRYPGQVHAIEVWNEQNISREWTSLKGLKASEYISLLRTTYEAVKAEDPGVIVISGALSPTGVSDGVGAWDDFTYMDQMIAAGLLNYSDCIGAHHNGYNIGPSVTWDSVPNDPNARFRGPFDNKHHSWSFRSTLQTYANKVAVAGGEQKLCVTEFGWASTEDLGGTPRGFEFAVDNTLEEQKQWTIEAIENMEEWDIVWLAFIWNLNYGPQAGWSTDNDNVPYSIIGKDWHFRPVYDEIGKWQTAYKERTGRS